MTLAEMPYTSTGPAITNSFAPRPRISPSLLNYIAGETMAFAKPVIGNKKRQQAVAPQRRIRTFAFEQLLIGLFIQFHARFPFLYA